MKQIRINEKLENIIKKWSDIYKKSSTYIHDAIIEYDIYLSMGLRPSQINDYDEFIERKKKFENKMND